MTKRTAYLLTTNKTSERTLFAQGVLQKIGFQVELVQHIPHSDLVVSNKISMLNIYNIIKHADDDYGYVFEDDIDTLDTITLEEILEYEKLAPVFFYLGLCKYDGMEGVKQLDITINNHPVFNVCGHVRGLHAIGVSKRGAESLLEMAHTSEHRYMDMIVEELSRKYPALVVRYDLESYIPGHRGVLFQDRNRFASMIPAD
jgi:hypothetical protein